MDTRVMFLVAQEDALPRYKLMANVIWTLVSQAGRSPLSVGEVANCVKFTSGIKPSAYQVKSIMNELQDMVAVSFHAGSRRGNGKETLYSAGPKIMLALALYVYALDHSDIQEMAGRATDEIIRSGSRAIAQVIEFNRSNDNPTVIPGDD